jgi:hypothetical protein
MDESDENVGSRVHGLPREMRAGLLASTQALDEPAARAETIGLVNASTKMSCQGSRDYHGATDGSAGTDHAHGTGIAMYSWT